MKRQAAAALMLIGMAFFFTETGGKIGPGAWTQPVTPPPLIVLPPREEGQIPSPVLIPGAVGGTETDGSAGQETNQDTEQGTGQGTEQGGEAIQNPTPEPDSSPEPLPDNVNPLTGRAMDPAAVRRRPVAVVFNNFRKAQPQLGVSQADIIYEVPAEGGITRMVGLYQSLDGVGNLGSIRSARTYVLEIALGYDALLVHAGGSPAAYEEIPAWGVDNMDGVRGKSDASIFWRDSGRRQSMGYEHSLLTSGEKITGYLGKGRYRTERRAEDVSYQRYAQDGTPADGGTAAQITVTFNDNKKTGFSYDSATGKYWVSQYNSQYKDGASGVQVSAENLLILRTTVKQIAGDEAGRLQVDTVGEDEGLFFCGGKYIPIRWSRPDRNSRFTYKKQDGAPLALQCGKSYICIVGHTDAVEIA